MTMVWIEELKRWIRISSPYHISNYVCSTCKKGEVAFVINDYEGYESFWRCLNEDCKEDYVDGLQKQIFVIGVEL